MALKRGEKKLILSCAFGFLTLTGVAIFYGYINATPTLQIPPHPKAPVPNGTELAFKAALKLTAPNPPLELGRDINPPTDPQARAQRYGLARKTAWLARNKAALAQLKRAQQAAWLQPRREFGQVVDWQPIQDLGDAKVVESNAHWLRGEHNAALQSALDVVQLSGDFPRGGGQLSHMAGTALSATAHRHTRDAVPFIGAAQAKSAARRLENLLATRWTLSQALQEEKYVDQQFIFDWFGQKNWRLMGMLGTKPPLWQGMLRTHTISKKQIIADIGAKYDHQIANTRLPFAAQKPPLDFPDDGFANFLQPFGIIHFSDARVQTKNRILLLRLALRAYQLENKTLPPNLQTLVPTYLQAVPLDPFDAGAPLRYRVKGATYVLWSIGFDGVDDGGQPITKGKATRSAQQRAKLPKGLANSWGDYVAGRDY